MEVHRRHFPRVDERAIKESMKQARWKAEDVRKQRQNAEMMVWAEMHLRIKIGKASQIRFHVFHILIDMFL